MPNWCNNSIYIEGPAEKLAFFISALEDKKGDGVLSSFFPMPDSKIQQLSESEECFLHDIRRQMGKEPEEVKLDEAWYFWRVHNWGTKWDVPFDDASWDLHGECLSLSFDTAWSPPIGWLTTVALLNPNLDFTIEYSEMGCWFAGKHTWKGGSLAESKEGEPDEFDFCEDEVAFIKEANEEEENE